MDTVREQLNRPLVLGITAFVLGLIIGLVLLGWVLFPVQWTDATPEHLRPDLQEDYLRMAIDSYSVNRDVALAQARYNSVGEDGPEILAAIQANPGVQSADSIAAFASAVGGAPGATLATPLPGTPAAGETAVGTPLPEATAQPAGGGFIRTLLPVLCVVLLLLAGALIAMFILRSRRGGMTTVTQTQPAGEAGPPATWTEFTPAVSEETPMAQFMASYKLGDDLFDDSFSIDSPSGEFLGECGVGISETIGVGDPKKVTAFEVWLFDKNDIQTVTKVLMSQHAFMDETVRQRLAAKGEPVLIEPGTETILETHSLRLVVRSVDMGYGEGPLPAQSFFDRLVLELAVWQKNQPA